MTELENVRKGLWMCEGGPENCGLKDCPYFDKREFCENELMFNALLLIEELEASLRAMQRTVHELTARQ